MLKISHQQMMNMAREIAEAYAIRHELKDIPEIHDFGIDYTQNTKLGNSELSFYILLDVYGSIVEDGIELDGDNSET